MGTWEEERWCTRCRENPGEGAVDNFASWVGGEGTELALAG